MIHFFEPPPSQFNDIGIWIRTAAKDSSAQLHSAKEFVSAHGGVVREIYDLSGQSGTSVTTHPEAQRMMDDVERGHIKTLVVKNMPRLSRNLDEVQNFVNHFALHDANLVSIQ